jgi:linoleoyl-CoA desaturase
MENTRLKTVHFTPPSADSFINAVSAAVNGYFRSTGLSPFANKHMWIKGIVMMLLYFVPYAIIVTGMAAGNTLLFFMLWFVMGWGMVGIGTSVMHDANHGSYTSSNTLNNCIGYMLDALGGSSLSWKIQHNVLHHTYTNIDGLDEDIDAPQILRFSPHAPLRWYHRYQHIYAWFFYMLLCLTWITTKDYMKVLKYHRTGLLARQKITLGKALTIITVSKLVYYAYILVLPLLYSGMPWHYVLAGFLLMHLVAGLFLSCVFQVAHVVSSSDYPLPSGDGKIEKSWAEHEMVTTVNFAPGNRFLTWFIGGLNYQIEHHLFPRICHVHYPRLAPYIKALAEIHRIPYRVEPTFFSALYTHARTLKMLGRQPAPPGT